MKSGRPHSVPLSSGLLTIIKSRAPLADYVFASGRRTGEPLATLQHSHAAIQEETGARFQIRDLRRTARSGFSALGVAPEAAERILAHAVPRLIATYDAHVPLMPMREALELWGREVARVVAARVARTAKGARKVRGRGVARPDEQEAATA